MSPKDVKTKTLSFLKDKRSLFLVVGGYNTLFGFLLINGMMLVFSDKYAVFILIICYPIQLVHNFFTFEKLVFRSNVGIFSGLMKLNNSYIVISAVSFALISFLVYILGVNDNLAYNIVLPFLIMMQFLIHKKYTFR